MNCPSSSDAAGDSRPLAPSGAAALRYGAQGWPVFPLHTPRSDGSCSCRQRAACPRPGKHPRTRHGLHDATTAAQQIRDWWARWPAANVGVATGRLVVIDVDGPAGTHALERLQREHEPLPNTLRAASARGAHLYFQAGLDAITNSAGQLGEGLDVRGHGGYIVAPPSLHASGHRYRWSIRRAPAPLPQWLAAALTPTAPGDPPRPHAVPPAGDRGGRYFTAAVRGELAAIATSQPGTRNDTLNRSAFRLAQLAASGRGPIDALPELLLAAALAAGLSEPEATATIASGLSAGQQHPRRPTARS